MLYFHHIVKHVIIKLMHSIYWQEIEPSVGEALCRLWKNVSETGNGHPNSSSSGGLSATQLKFASRLGTANTSAGHHMSQPMTHHHHLHPHPMYATPHPFVHPAAYHVQAIMAHQQRSNVFGQMMGGYHQPYNPQSSGTRSAGHHRYSKQTRRPPPQKRTQFFTI